MNTDKPQLMIVEEDNEFIQIWKDYFSQRFKINFIKNNSNLIVDPSKLFLGFSPATWAGHRQDTAGGSVGRTPDNNPEALVLKLEPTLQRMMDDG